MKAMKDLVEDPQDTLEVVATTMRKMYKSVLNPKNDFEELSINLQEIEGIVDDRERERKQQEKLRAIQEWEEAERIRKESLMSNKEISVSQADAVMVTFTFLYDPPPLYSRHPPRTWKDEVKDLTAKSLNGLESLKQLNKSLTIPLPLIKKRIRKDDTSSNVNANTDPVKISSFVTKCNEQSTMKDSLHESSSLSLVTAEDDNLEELEEESDSSIEADDAENDLSKASPKEKKVARTPKTSSQADNVVSPTKGSIKKRPLVHPKIIPKAILVGKPNTGLLAIEDLIIKPTDQVLLMINYFPFELF